MKNIQRIHREHEEQEVSNERTTRYSITIPLQRPFNPSSNQCGGQLYSNQDFIDIILESKIFQGN